MLKFVIGLLGDVCGEILVIEISFTRLEAVSCSRLVSQVGIRGCYMRLLYEVGIREWYTRLVFKASM